MVGLLGRTKRLTISSTVWIQYTNVTDRRTDGLMDRQTYRQTPGNSKDRAYVWRRAVLREQVRLSRACRSTRSTGARARHLVNGDVICGRWRCADCGLIRLRTQIRRIFFWIRGLSADVWWTKIYGRRSRYFETRFH